MSDQSTKKFLFFGNLVAVPNRALPKPWVVLALGFALSGYTCANEELGGAIALPEEYETYLAYCDSERDDDYTCHISYVELVNLINESEFSEVISILDDYLLQRVDTNYGGESIFHGRDSRDFDLLCKIDVVLSVYDIDMPEVFLGLDRFYFKSNSAYLVRADLDGGAYSLNGFEAACSRYQNRFDYEL